MPLYVDNEVSFATCKKVPELLWLIVKATGEKEHNKDFLKAEGAYFEIGKNCYCNRDITTTEFENILRKLRESEKILNTTKLFYADNCKLDDKTVSSFLLKLNEIFKRYDITTCIRKIHFLGHKFSTQNIPILP